MRLTVSIYSVFFLMLGIVGCGQEPGSGDSGAGDNDTAVQSGTSGSNDTDAGNENENNDLRDSGGSGNGQGNHGDSAGSGNGQGEPQDTSCKNVLCEPGQLCIDGACSSCLDDPLEPNDSAGVGSRFGHYDGLTICSGDEDFFCGDLSVGDALWARIWFTQASGDIDAALLLDGEPVARSLSVNDNEVIALPPAETAGHYCLRVYTYGEVTNQYDLDIAINPSDVTLCDSNSDCSSSESESLHCNEWKICDRVVPCTDPSHPGCTDGTICDEASGQCVSVPCTDPNHPGCTGGTVCDDASGECVLPPCTHPEHPGCTDGTVCDEETGRCVSPCPQDPKEPNNDRSSGTSIDAGTIDGLIVCRDDPDFFCFDLQDGDSARVSVDFVHEQGDIDVKLYGPSDDAPIDQGIGTLDGEAVAVIDASAGTYCAKVYLISVLGSNNYSLTLDINPSAELCREDDECSDGLLCSRKAKECVERIPCTPDDSMEPNDTQDQASTVTVDQPLGELWVCKTEVGDNPDWYRLDLGESDIGKTLTASLTFAHANGDIDVRIFAPGGERLGTGFSTDDNENVSASIAQPGSYYIKVYMVGSGLRINSYSMTLNLE